MSRVKERMTAMGLNNAQLAAACKVKPPTSFNWASGKTKNIKGEPLLLAAKTLGVTPEWLATGTGQKFPKGSYEADNPKVTVNAAEQSTAYTNWPFDLVDKERYERLSPHAQGAAQMRMMDEIAAQEAAALKANGTFN